MRRYFSGSRLGSSLRNELRSSQSAAPKGRNVSKTTKGIFKENLELENLSTANSIFSSWVEAAHEAQVSATYAAKSAALALISLRQEIAREVVLDGNDPLFPDFQLHEEAAAESDKNTSLQKTKERQLKEKDFELEGLPIRKRSLAANPNISLMVEAAREAQFSAASAAKSTALATGALRREVAVEVAFFEESTTDADKDISLRKGLPIFKRPLAAHPIIASLVEATHVAQVSAASAAKSTALAMDALRQQVAQEVALDGDDHIFSDLALSEDAIKDGDKNISLQKNSPICKRSLAANPTIASLVEVAQLAQISAAPAAKYAALALTALRKEVGQMALAGNYQVCPDLALFDEANADSDKKNSLQKILISLQNRFWSTELKRDPDDREKLPKTLPNVEIESNNIANLLVEEPLIIFLEAPFFGEKGQVTGQSSHGLLYTDNKGVPLRILTGKHFNGSMREVALYALESSLFDADKKFPLIRYRIFSARKSLVKAVQETMRRLKAGEKVSNDRYTKVAETLIAKGSTIEFIAAKDNHIAHYLAYLAWKIGIQFLEVDLPSKVDLKLWSLLL